MDRLRSLDACLIRGNAEQYQIDYARSGSLFNSLMHGIIFWTHQVIGDRGIAWMESLPETAAPALPGLPPLRMVHASPGSLSRGLVPDDPPVQAVFHRAGLGNTPRSPLSSILEMIPESVLICGHTHIPWQERHGEKLAFNPGAVGMPINGDPRAQYALLEWRAGQWQVEHRAVSYDWDLLKAACRESGLMETGGAFARACLANMLSGHNVA